MPILIYCEIWLRNRKMEIFLCHFVVVFVNMNTPIDIKFAVVSKTIFKS